MGEEDCPLITRIGLRYTNHCRLNEEMQKSFSDYFNSPVSNLFSAPSKLTDLQLRIIEPIDKNGLITQASIVKDPKNKDMVYILDFDTFTTEPVEFANILE